MRSINILIIIFSLTFNTIGPLPTAHGQEMDLPVPGVMVNMTPRFDPMMVKGIKFYPENPFKFDFIADTGDVTLTQDQIKEQGQKLATYFLASLTTPDSELWVNLSPYEKNRIIPRAFGNTQMGQALLSEDYVLKQIMATALYPERQLGRDFWQRVYAQALRQFGTTNVPVNTYNKVWIVPDKAVVYENSGLNSVFVIQSSLKVLMEQDYLAMDKHDAGEVINRPYNDINNLGSNIIRQIIIPALEKEVNEGRNFARLRQVYQSFILASWYKKNLRDNVLAKGYVDHGKTKGIDASDKNSTEKIYQRYLQAYRKGVYSYVKDEFDPSIQQMIPRKYFSGGIQWARNLDLAMATPDEAGRFSRAMMAGVLRNKWVQIAFLALAVSAVGAFISPSSVQAAPVSTHITFQMVRDYAAHERLSVKDREGLTHKLNARNFEWWAERLGKGFVVIFDDKQYTVQGNEPSLMAILETISTSGEAVVIETSRPLPRSLISIHLPKAERFLTFAGHRLSTMQYDTQRNVRYLNFLERRAKQWEQYLGRFPAGKNDKLDEDIKGVRALLEAIAQKRTAIAGAGRPPRRVVTVEIPVTVTSQLASIEGVIGQMNTYFAEGSEVLRLELQELRAKRAQFEGWRILLKGHVSKDTKIQDDYNAIVNIISQLDLSIKEAVAAQRSAPRAVEAVLPEAISTQLTAIRQQMTEVREILGNITPETNFDDLNRRRHLLIDGRKLITAHVKQYPSLGSDLKEMRALIQQAEQAMEQHAKTQRAAEALASLKQELAEKIATANAALDDLKTYVDAQSNITADIKRELKGRRVKLSVLLRELQSERYKTGDGVADVIQRLKQALAGIDEKLALPIPTTAAIEIPAEINNLLPVIKSYLGTLEGRLKRKELTLQYLSQVKEQLGQWQGTVQTYVGGLGEGTAPQPVAVILGRLGKDIGLIDGALVQLKQELTAKIVEADKVVSGLSDYADKEITEQIKRELRDRRTRLTVLLRDLQSERYKTGEGVQDAIQRVQTALDTIEVKLKQPVVRVTRKPAVVLNTEGIPKTFVRLMPKGFIWKDLVSYLGDETNKTNPDINFLLKQEGLLAEWIKRFDRQFTDMTAPEAELNFRLKIKGYLEDIRQRLTQHLSIYTDDLKAFDTYLGENSTVDERVRAHLVEVQTKYRGWLKELAHPSYKGLAGVPEIVADMNIALGKIETALKPVGVTTNEIPPKIGNIIHLIPITLKTLEDDLRNLNGRHKNDSRSYLIAKQSQLSYWIKTFNEVYPEGIPGNFKELFDHIQRDLVLIDEAWPKVDPHIQGLPLSFVKFMPSEVEWTRVIADLKNVGSIKPKEIDFLKGQGSILVLWRTSLDALEPEFNTEERSFYTQIQKAIEDIDQLSSGHSGELSEPAPFLVNFDLDGPDWQGVAPNIKEIVRTVHSALTALDGDLKPPYLKHKDDFKTYFEAQRQQLRDWRSALTASYNDSTPQALINFNKMIDTYIDRIGVALSQFDQELFGKISTVESELVALQPYFAEGAVKTNADRKHLREERVKLKGLLTELSSARYQGIDGAAEMIVKIQGALSSIDTALKVSPRSAVTVQPKIVINAQGIPVIFVKLMPDELKGRRWNALMAYLKDEKNRERPNLDYLKRQESLLTAWMKAIDRSFSEHGVPDELGPYRTQLEGYVNDIRRRISTVEGPNSLPIAIQRELEQIEDALRDFRHLLTSPKPINLEILQAQKESLEEVLRKIQAEINTHAEWLSASPARFERDAREIEEALDKVNKRIGEIVSGQNLPAFLPEEEITRIRSLTPPTKEQLVLANSLPYTDVELAQWAAVNLVRIKEGTWLPIIDFRALQYPLPPEAIPGNTDFSISLDYFEKYWRAVWAIRMGTPAYIKREVLVKVSSEDIVQQLIDRGILLERKGHPGEVYLKPIKYTNKDALDKDFTARVALMRQIAGDNFKMVFAYTLDSPLRGFSGRRTHLHQNRGDVNPGVNGSRHIPGIDGLGNAMDFEVRGNISWGRALGIMQEMGFWAIIEPQSATNPKGHIHADLSESLSPLNKAYYALLSSGYTILELPNMIGKTVEGILGPPIDIFKIAIPSAGKGRNHAMISPEGGIDLGQLILNTQGTGGVRTAFSDPRILHMLLESQGLFPQVQSVKTLTVPMVNQYFSNHP